MSAIIEENIDKNALLSFEYNSNAEITYVFYDTKYNTILREKLNIVVSRDAVAEFENDVDVINILFMNEMLLILGVSGIDDIATRCMEMFDMINESSLSTCLDLLATRPAAGPIALIPLIDDTNTMRQRVFPILFSYDLLFFTHICLRDLFVDGSIKPLHLETLCEAIREYI
jgi:hypothetical protein